MICEDVEGSCAWASCQCDAEFINGIADLEAEWNPKHHIRGGFGTRSRISKRFQLFQYHSIKLLVLPTSLQMHFTKDPKNVAKTV